MGIWSFLQDLQLWVVGLVTKKIGRRKFNASVVNIERRTCRNKAASERRKSKHVNLGLPTTVFHDPRIKRILRGPLRVFNFAKSIRETGEIERLLLLLAMVRVLNQLPRRPQLHRSFHSRLRRIATPWLIHMGMMGTPVVVHQPPTRHG